MHSEDEILFPEESLSRNQKGKKRTPKSHNSKEGLDLNNDFDEFEESVRQRVMIIEGDSYVLRRLRSTLKDLFQVQTESAIENALEELEKTHFDLVITSLDWPIFQDESDILQAIKELFGYWDVPIVAIGYEPDSKTRSEYMDMGFEEYFTRPLDPWLIRQSIIEILHIDN